GGQTRSPARRRDAPFPERPHAQSLQPVDGQARGLEDLRLVREGFREGPQGFHVGEAGAFALCGPTRRQARGPRDRSIAKGRRGFPRLRLGLERFRQVPAIPAYLSIIVPTLNEASGIAAALARLQPWRGECEVIVADGGSDDATTDVARPLADQVVESE